MNFNLQSTLDCPLTIQLCEQKIIPFKIIVKCQNQELALYTYQRPVTKKDGFLFEFMNERNLKNLAKEIEDFKIQLKEEFEKQYTEDNKFEDRYEATCKLFLGSSYLQIENKKRKQKNYENFKIKTQLLQKNEYIESQMFSANNHQLYQSVVVSKPDQDDIPLKQLQIIENKSQKTLVCGVYENESYSQILEFISSFKGQNVDLVILYNGIDSLEIKLKECLFMNHDKSTKIKEEIKKNQFSVDNALVLQYQKSQDNLPRVMFIIKYFKSSNYDLQRWIYNGIGKYFDPDYFYVTRCSLIQQKDSITTQMSSIISRNLCGISGNILHNQTSSWNPLNHCNAFLLDQTIDELDNISKNKLFSIMDHNPFFCFYNWQKVKQFIDSYLQKIIKSECDYAQNIISQGANYILPSLAAEKGLFFGKSNLIFAKAEYSDELSKNMNEQRKRKNSKIYANCQFQSTYSSQSSNWQINSFTKIIQLIGLKLMFLYSSLNNYFSISAILFIFSQSSYDFFGNAFDYYYLYILQFSIPALFIFSAVIFLIFAILFTSQYKIQRAKRSKDQIFVNGSLVLHIIHSPSFNFCSYFIENQKQTIIQKRNNQNIDPNKIKFIGSSPNQNVLKLFFEYEKSIYCACQNQTNSILDEILRKARLSKQSIKKNDYIEYFVRTEVNDLCFNHQNSKQDASEQFKVLFYLMAVFNFIFLALIILNLVFNYNFKVDSTYRFIILVSVLMIILEKVIQIQFNSSHMKIFIRGYLSYLFYYIVIDFGMKFYEKINTDNNYENEKIKEFYYQKVQQFAIWISYNIIFLFICFMIEAYYEFCGYVLLVFLCYFAVCSLLSIFFTVISKCCCYNLKNKNSKMEINEIQNESYQYDIEQFILSEELNYENQFLKIQQQANQNFYEQQNQFQNVQLKSLQQAAYINNTQNRLAVINEDNSLLQSKQSSTGQFDNRNSSSRSLQKDIKINECDSYDSMLFSNRGLDQKKQ